MCRLSRDNLFAGGLSSIFSLTFKSQEQVNEAKLKQLGGGGEETTFERTKHRSIFGTNRCQMAQKTRKGPQEREGQEPKGQTCTTGQGTSRQQRAVGKV